MSGLAVDGSVPARARAARYTETAMWFHWITAVLMFAILPIAWVMTSLPSSDGDAGWFFMLHKSLGITIFVLVAARIAWRATHPAPALPAPPTPVGRATTVAAGASHLLLYAVLVVMPVSGYVMSAMSSYPLTWFGLPLPKLGQVASVRRVSTEIHLLGQWAVYGLIVLHLFGTGYHVVVARDGALSRMLPRQRTA